MALWRYVYRRLWQMAIVLLGISVITFVLARYVPGDPVLHYLGERARDETIQRLRERWGLDRPVWEQYVIFIKGLLQGDLGTSISTQHPVTSDLAEFFPFTIELATSALLVSVVVGVPLGVISAVKRNKTIDHASRIFALAGSSTPIFWLAIMTIYLFYFRLGWVPGAGVISSHVQRPATITGLYTIDSLITGNFPAFLSTLHHLILPSLVLGSYSTALTTRIVRSSMLEILGQDYVRTARAKGLPERIVIYKHALKNTLIATVTIIGLNYGGLLSGAVITETVFARPGLGTYSIGTMLALDYPAIVGVTLVATIVYACINLVVDLLYGFLDPRIRYG